MSDGLFAPPSEIEPYRPSRLQQDIEAARRADEPGVADPERDAFFASGPGRRLRERLEMDASRREMDARRRRRNRVFAGSAVGVVAAVAASLLLVLGGPAEESGSGSGLGEGPSRLPAGNGQIVPYDRDVVAKGGSALAAFRKRGSDVAPVLDGAYLLAGDRLRFTYRTPRRYVLVVDLEARGGVSPFYPYPAAGSLRLLAERGELPGSIELNESLGDERLVALFSDTPLAYEAVVAAIERAYPRDGGGKRDLTVERSLGLDADVVSLRFVKRAGLRP